MNELRPPQQPPSAETLDRLRAAVGEAGWLDSAADMAPHLKEERGLFTGTAAAVVRPGSTAEVADVVRICAETGVPIVPQAGNTGLVGGGIPFDGERGIVLSLARMNQVRDVDPLNFTITADAGCILADIQTAADEADRFFPLSLGAEGSCRIGGNISTNAGGVNVLRYGNMRDLVLGLEVVLPDGRIWDGLGRLRKDNTGYDLKHWFIGAEGTLGVITGAVLKLFPKPRRRETAFAAVRDPAAALDLLARLRAATSDAVSSFELMPRIGLDMVLAHIDGVRDPLAETHAHYVLIELSGGQEDDSLRALLEAELAAAIEAGAVIDAAIAESGQQAADFWRIRDTMSEAQKPEGGSIKHDVSVPVSRVPEFLARADAAVEAALPGVRVVAFGHLGDGNMHYNLSQPVEGWELDAFLGEWERMNRIVHDIVADMDGSISAEHGIGRLKRDELPLYKSAVALDLMRQMKATLDPKGIMNPGKVI